MLNKQDIDFISFQIIGVLVVCPKYFHFCIRLNYLYNKHVLSTTFSIP